jgi:probable FeS assembly SUF system protein SufT
MTTSELISLARDCEAVLIPSGEKVRLASGTQVRITQSLGGSFTILTDRGSMARISGKDGDALGLQSASASPAASAAPGESAGVIEQQVWEQLRSCFDPEIPVNVVELGLIYGCTATPLAGGGCKVEVRFTLTAPGCGMGQVLREDIKSKIAGVPGVREVAVDLVWEPPWDQSRISHEAKVELGIE